MTNESNTTARFLPEWAPVKAVLLAWPYPHGDWRNNIEQVQSCYWHLLEALTQYADVWLLLHPSLEADAWRETMPEVNIQWPRVKVHNHIAYNDTWIRDYGPLSTSAGYLSFQFNGWGGKYPASLDNEAGQKLFGEHKLSLQKFEFVGEGGALETNGRTLLMNRDCVVDPNRNAELNQQQTEELLKSTLGMDHICWLSDINLTGDDTDGHIDTIARFASDNSVIYSGRNSAHSDAQALESLHSQLQQLAGENNWQLYELPTPQIKSLLDERVLPATYANFLIVNDAVLVPLYGVEEDRLALRVMAQAFPEYRLVPVRCEALLEQHGSLHCATMQVAWL